MRESKSSTELAKVNLKFSFWDCYHDESFHQREAVYKAQEECCARMKQHTGMVCLKASLYFKVILTKGASKIELVRTKKKFKRSKRFPFFFVALLCHLNSSAL